LPIQHLHINHDGIFGDDRHQNKPIASYHNVYRALDLNAIMITRQDGTKMEFNYEKGAAAIILAEERGIELTEEEKKEFNFWKKFRTCWTQQIQLYFKEHAPDSNCRTQSGTVGWENEDHKHHLHLSLPFCPPKRGFRRS